MNYLVYLSLVTLGWTALFILVFFLTFVFYAAVIKFRSIRDSGLLSTLSPSVQNLMYAALYLGEVLDLILDWLFLSIYYWELPKEILSTSRVKRWYWSEEDTRNKRKSIWFAKNFLLPIDPHHMDK